MKHPEQQPQNAAMLLEATVERAKTLASTVTELAYRPGEPYDFPDYSAHTDSTHVPGVQVDVAFTPRDQVRLPVLQQSTTLLGRDVQGSSVVGRRWFEHSLEIDADYSVNRHTEWRTLAPGGRAWATEEQGRITDAREFVLRDPTLTPAGVDTFYSERPLPAMGTQGFMQVAAHLTEIAYGQLPRPGRVAQAASALMRLIRHA